MTQYILYHFSSFLFKTRGVRGGAEPTVPPYAYPPEGGTPGGGSFNITAACISLPQAIYIVLHPNLKIKKRNWLSIALNIQVSHFENWLFLFVVSLQKCDPPFIEWHVRCTFETFIISIVSEARNARVTFVEKPQIKIISFKMGNMDV